MSDKEQERPMETKVTFTFEEVMEAMEGYIEAWKSSVDLPESFTCSKIAIEPEYSYPPIAGFTFYWRENKSDD